MRAMAMATFVARFPSMMVMVGSLPEGGKEGGGGRGEDIRMKKHGKSLRK
jgi:hypothetical protein